MTFRMIFRSSKTCSSRGGEKQGVRGVWAMDKPLRLASGVLLPWRALEGSTQQQKLPELQSLLIN